ncbi:MAG TPA: ribulose-phosphate 3-epimerase [Candidatus Dormibacteraeota bacterium]|nr:ribulose-phosphate 3-epimerase [Candidatus Dormibacteraeota bacterium]
MRVAVSLASADPLRIAEAAERAATAGASALHVDFGDGRFVPWLGGGVELVAALVRLAAIPVDVHLMVEEPEPYFAPLAAAGATSVVAHIERAPYPWRLRALAHRSGMQFGLALNPATPISDLEPVISCADYLVLLTTEPDGAGELMLPNTLERVQAARALIGPDRALEIDGGVTGESLTWPMRAAVDRLVVGRAVLDSAEPAILIAHLASGNGVGVR